MTKWERLQFDMFRQLVKNSPTLDNSRKLTLERMLDQMEGIWENTSKRGN